MANSNKNGIASTNISALHCIDLSSPDIHTSVSLLKKVPLSLSHMCILCVRIYVSEKEIREMCHAYVCV